jgi:3,5-epimerase/4-reductase
MSTTTTSATTTVLVYGGKGWIASQIIPLFQEQGWNVVCSQKRADNTSEVRKEIATVKPDRVVCLLGRTHGEGINSIDYLEQPGKLVDNLRDNLYAPLSLSMICSFAGIHFTYLGTGCIFDDPDPTTVVHTEMDDPNFWGSSYSTVKGFTDRLMRSVHNKNILNVRIRMPITSDNHPRNFITKIVSYQNIFNMPNSMTVLPTLLPVMVDMIKNKSSGTVNLVNPGVITHNEILEMYKTHVDPEKTWTNVTREEHDAMLSSKRSNNQLSTDVLEALYPDVPTIHDAVKECILAMAKANTTM